MSLANLTDLPPYWDNQQRIWEQNVKLYHAWLSGASMVELCKIRQCSKQRMSDIISQTKRRLRSKPPIQYILERAPGNDARHLARGLSKSLKLAHKEN